MADYVKKRTHIINHVRFLEAGAVARDLYDWGMLWSGQQETDGEIPTMAVIASPWGAGGKKNLPVAEKLIAVGLWEKTSTGYRVCRWAEQGNVTKAELVAKREFDRTRKAAQRANAKRVSDESPERLSNDCPTGTPSGFPTSLSSSPSSGSDLRGGAGGGLLTMPDGVPVLAAQIPERLREHAQGLVQSAGEHETFDISVSWGKYVAWCVDARQPIREGRWARWVADDIKRHKRDRGDIAARSARGAGGGPRGDRQPLGDLSWLKTGTGGDS